MPEVTLRKRRNTSADLSKRRYEYSMLGHHRLSSSARRRDSDVGCLSGNIPPFAYSTVTSVTCKGVGHLREVKKNKPQALTTPGEDGTFIVERRRGGD
jgi:hypothetical protein